MSVVIPSFRGGRYLREAIASVQKQTFANWELIVVLDGCDDDLTDLTFADGRVRVLKQKNRGECTSRNVGIEHAKSPLIALLDDDDRMLPGRLSAQIEAMSDERIGACHTQFRIIDENGCIVSAGNSKETQYSDFLSDEGSVLISTTILRKSMIEEVGGFNPLLPIAGDLDLLYRVARESRMQFLPEVLTEYRRHSSNTWSNPSLGGEVRKLILYQHLLVAQSHGESENVRLIRHGLSRIPTDKVGGLLYSAHKARIHRNYLLMLVCLARAFLRAPLFTVKVSVRQTYRHLRREAVQQ